MKRFILTGAPGTGKTAIIRQLELDGFGLAEEAATDIVALAQARGVDAGWREPSFIDSIVDLQRRRQIRASCQTDEVQFSDLSPPPKRASRMPCGLSSCTKKHI